jgi:hypothetical protein
MRNRRSTEISALLAAVLALAGIFFSVFGFGPRVDRKVHQEIGQALAKEAVGLLGKGGQIAIVTRDTASFRQPAIEMALAGFKQEILRAGAVIASTQEVQVDPLRPVEVPPGDFFELIRRAPAQNVIVSFMGPPLLTDAQRGKLGRIQPKIVAFCSGSLAENVDLRRLFEAGLLHAAVVNRRLPPDGSDKAQKITETFAQLYVTVTARDLSKLPPPAGTAL